MATGEHRTARGPAIARMEARAASRSHVVYQGGAERPWLPSRRPVAAFTRSVRSASPLITTRSWGRT